MKKNEITVGTECYTKVGNERVKVRVVSIIEEPASAWRKVARTTYGCKRVDNGNMLPKRRLSSALHAIAA